MAYQYYVYIMTNSKKNVLYIGMTNNLKRRIWEHKQGIIDGFSQQYKTNILVYYELTDDVKSAIMREKQLKKWKRLWKNELIASANPDWLDLSENLPD